MEEMETGEEPEDASDEDYYDDTYANRRRKRGTAATGPGSRGGRTRKSQPDDTPAKRGRAGRGRKRGGQGTLPYEVPGDAEKPYGCELCGAKYKTRPGLTYHYTHTHKDPPAGAASGGTPAPASDGDSRDSRAHTPPAHAPPPAMPATEYQDSVAAAATRRPSPPPRPASADTSSSDSAQAPLVPQAPQPDNKPDGDNKASPSPYCDFCLGDDRENKKTGTPEELVSCSDCGRSGKTCYHLDNRVCERHRHLQENIRLNGVVEILTSMSYSADAFDNFARQTKLLKDEYVNAMSPPSRQSPTL